MRQTLLARTLFSRTRLPGAGGLFALAIVSLLLGIGAVAMLQRDVATAAPQSTVNFQARLKSSGSAVVPDGYYNVHFRLYTASSGGTSVWDEFHIDANGATAGSDNRVRTSEGYLSVGLGSITPFPSTIDWGEEMWLTIDVGGTSQVVEASIVWDSEMSPRIKLTALPYAFMAEQAKTLQTTTGANTSTLGWETQTAPNAITLPNAGGIVCLQTSTACGFALATGGSGYIQNSTIQQTSSNFNIDGTGQAGTLNATTAIQLNGANINTAGTLSNVAYLNQVTTFKATTDSADAFRVQNAAGTSTVLNVSTTGSVVSAGTASTSDTFTTLTNPSTISGSQLSATAWSSDAKYLAVGADSASSDRLIFYKRTVNSLAAISGQPAVLPGSNVKAIAWSPDTRYVAVGSNTTTGTKLTIYSRSGDVFTEVADPATLPGNGVTSVTWSPDGAYLSVASDALPSLTTYKRSGSTFTKIADPDVVPGITASTASWSPDGRYLAFGHATTGTDRFKIYKRSGDRLTKLTDPGTLPGGAVYSTTWSPDGTYLAVGSAATPFITIYKRSGDTFTKLTNPAYLPTGAGEVRSVDFSPGGTYLALAGNTNGVDRFVVYKRSVDTFTQVSTGATSGNYGMSLDITSGGFYLAVASNNGSGNRFTWMRIGNGTRADFTASGNVNVAGQVVANSLDVSSAAADAASFGSLAATSTTVQSQVVADTLTVAGNVSLASSTGTPGLLQFGVMNSVTDPVVASDGAMYFNSSLNALRCYRNGAWEDCVTAGVETVFTQDGNAFGETAVLGTNDAYGLNIMTNGTTLASASATGDITFTPTSSLQVQDANGVALMDVDVAAGEVTLGGASVGSWSTTTVMPEPVGCNDGHNPTFVYNGYIYTHDAPVWCGGADSMAIGTIAADGSISSWAQSANILDTNWGKYAYGLGTGTVERFELQADGSIVSAGVDTLTLTGSYYRMFAANGYLYLLSQDVVSVAYAPITSNGTLGTWTEATLSSPVSYGADGGLNGAKIVAANGHIYVFGHYIYSYVLRADINVDGSLSAWVSEPAWPFGTQKGAVVITGNTVIGHSGNSDDVAYSTINSDGSLGAWSIVADQLPIAGTSSAGVALYGERMYILGGDSAATGVETYVATVGTQVDVNGSLSVSGPLTITAGATTLGGQLTVAGAMEISDHLLVQAANGDNALSVDVTLGVVTVGTASTMVYYDAITVADAPGGNQVSSDWTDDGEYLAVGAWQTGSTSLTVYRNDGNHLTKLTVSGLPTGTTTRSVDWSPDGTFLAIGRGSGGTVSLIERSGDTLTYVSSTSDLDGEVYGVEWSPDGNYLATASWSTASNRIALYSWNGSTLTELSGEPSTLPGTNIGGLSWSPDSVYLAASGASGSGGQLTVYKRSGDTFTVLADPTLMPNGDTWPVAFSPDGRYLAVGAYAAGAGDNVVLYEQSGDTFTAVDTSNQTNVREISWGINSDYFAISSDSNFTGTFYVSAGELTWVSGLDMIGADSSEPAGVVKTISHSANSENLFVGGGTAYGAYYAEPVTQRGDLIVGSSITSDVLMLGSPEAASLAGAKLIVTTMEIQTSLRLGSVTNGISFNDITTGSSGKLRLYGNSRNVQTVTLTPEYAGAVLDGSGNGTMTTGYDSSARKNYYRWTSAQTTAQTYSVVVRHTLPADWTGWSPGAGICLDAWTSSTTLGLATLSVDGTDALADLTSQSVTPSSTSTWANTCFELDESQYTAGGVMEVTLTVSAEDAASVEIGPLRLTHLSGF